MNLQENVINVVSWAAKINPNRICLTTSLQDDLLLDEIDKMTIILEFEKWFNIELSSEDADSIETIKDLSDCVLKYQDKYAA
ncbi:MAG: acyl carrier protein [Saprospiraceae bacterium]|jgi:acyl carrier protein